MQAQKILKNYYTRKYKKKNLNNKLVTHYPSLTDTLAASYCVIGFELGIQTALFEKATKKSEKISLNLPNYIIILI